MGEYRFIYSSHEQRILTYHYAWGEIINMNIKITSDSTCDLPSEVIERYNIGIIPLYIQKGNSEYQDGVNIVPEDIFAHMEAGGDPCKTAAVSVSDYMEQFSKYAPKYDAVIHIDISSEFSCCYNNACIAAKEFDNVYVVDSRNLSSGHGHIVIEACQRAESGMDPKQICEELNELAPRVDASFILCKLDYLRKGGRCSAVAELGANLLQLKPCIEVKDGKMLPGKKYRGTFKSCIEKYIGDRLEGQEDLVLDRIFITHAAVPEMEEVAREMVAQHRQFKEVLTSRAGCTVSCHCGPQTIGILYIRKSPK